MFNITEILPMFLCILHDYISKAMEFPAFRPLLSWHQLASTRDHIRLIVFLSACISGNDLCGDHIRGFWPAFDADLCKSGLFKTEPQQGRFPGGVMSDIMEQRKMRMVPAWAACMEELYACSKICNKAFP